MSGKKITFEAAVEKLTKGKAVGSVPHVRNSCKLSKSLTIDAH
jgi:hypothetical protein